MKQQKAILAVAILLMFATKSSSQTAPTVSAVVAKTHCHPDKGVTTLHVVHGSEKEISAFGVDLRAGYPDGTVSAPGASEWICDMVEGLAQGKGEIQAGGSFDHDLPGYPGPVRAVINIVTYTDDAADVSEPSGVSERCQRGEFNARFGRIK